MQQTADHLRDMLGKVRWDESVVHEERQRMKPEPAPLVPQVDVEPEYEFDFEAELAAMQPVMSDVSGSSMSRGRDTPLRLMDDSPPPSLAPGTPAPGIQFPPVQLPVQIHEPVQYNPFSEEELMRAALQREANRLDMLQRYQHL